MRSLQWDIFCNVIDNFGDIGVCWRLAADLADRGQRVRLWVEDSSALAWMAPAGYDKRNPALQVLSRPESNDVPCLDASPSDVLVEAFGCDIAPLFIADCARIYGAKSQKDCKKPLLINLEYLSAEPYVAKSHGLTSLVSRGPATGWQRVFYYPGFTTQTGGLLREPDLLDRQAVFDRASWLQQQGITWQGEMLVSLFCYEPPALAQLLHELDRNGLHGQPVRLLVAAGRAAAAVKSSRFVQTKSEVTQSPEDKPHQQLSISYLPLLSQADFDHLLWASDLNFVRGEDSLVRAIWAGKPFVWQIYPQDDGAHEPKLASFLSMLDASPSLREFHQVWNGLANQPLPPLIDLASWRNTATSNRSRLAQQPDLVSGLLEFSAKSR